jgi:hypothetical protein
MLGACSVFLPYMLLWLGSGPRTDPQVLIPLALFAFTVSFITGKEYMLASMLSSHG